MATDEAQGQRAHVDETVEQLGRLYQEHDERTTPVQRVANRLTASLSRPSSLVVIFGAMIAWTVGNEVARAFGSAALERFPFPDLEFVATVTALLIALLILTTQRHQDDLAERRARLTLQIAALSEKKIAKIIELLEEQRRDNPMLPTRADAVAASMAVSVDPSDDLGEPAA
ncbi:DUF1003 domain-containing protein [Sphingomonas bacterium]|uniref:DUF1003 domain-containing protein n=1 Tax=Sphingomonas bacterium TaxID=1895847 RepID=UPI0015761F7F|nr:DUF1003 domain-containing protein [Sphingomonas bacterium]